MILLDFLRTLRATPDDPESPFLYVSRGDLSTEEESYVLGDEYGNRPYALVFGLPDAGEVEFANGAQQRVKFLDVVLEQRPAAPGELPYDGPMYELYKQASAAPAAVKEFMPGVPLHERLVYAGGLGEPESKHNANDWLICGLRFEARYLSRY